MADLGLENAHDLVTSTEESRAYTKKLESRIRKFAPVEVRLQHANFKSTFAHMSYHRN